MTNLEMAKPSIPERYPERRAVPFITYPVPKVVTPATPLPVPERISPGVPRTPVPATR